MTAFICDAAGRLTEDRNPSEGSWQLARLNRNGTTAKEK